LAARPLSRSERLEMEQDTMPGAAAPGELPGEFYVVISHTVTPAVFASDKYLRLLSSALIGISRIRA